LSQQKRWDFWISGVFKAVKWYFIPTFDMKMSKNLRKIDFFENICLFVIFLINFLKLRITGQIS